MLGTGELYMDCVMHDMRKVHIISLFFSFFEKDFLNFYQKQSRKAYFLIGFARLVYSRVIHSVILLYMQLLVNSLKFRCFRKLI